MAKDEPIPVLRPQLPTADQLLPYLRRIDASRTYGNFGPLSAELERRLAQHFGLAEGSITCTSSGTAALIAAILAAAGVARSRRKLAMVPDFTFVASAIAVERCGYQPYLVDIDAKSWMLDPARLLDHPRLPQVGLVVPVAPFGRPVPQAPWHKFQAATGIPVVIDGAASFACIAQDPKPYLGAIPIAFSFHATKSFGVGEGGCVAWTNADASDRLVKAVNFGFFGQRNSVAASINGKMSEYHAAVGLAELDGWSDKLAALCSGIDAYRAVFTKRGLARCFVGFPSVDPSYPLFVAASVAQCTRIRAALEEAGIGFRQWYGAGVHDSAHYTATRRDELSVAISLAQRVIGLPMAPDLPVRQIERVCSVIAHAVSAEPRGSMRGLPQQRHARVAKPQRGAEK